MGLADLLYSVWNPIKSEETSIAISQGRQYNGGRVPSRIIEGFDGMLGPTQANVLNQQDQVQHRIMEDKFNNSLSDYARAQKNLMDKTQTYIQNTASTNQRNKNIYVAHSQPSDEIHPKWKGCYAGGKGLIHQEDMGNSATQSACKTRASDLGYSNFSLANGKCSVGNLDEQGNGPAYKSVVSYAFKPNKDATMGGLLKNGQIGTFSDNQSNLMTDLNAVPGCDAFMGGLINTRNTVASYGANCNVPAPPPSTIEYHFENTGKHMTWESSNEYAKSKGGYLASLNELIDYIKKNGSVALVPGEDQWVAVTNGFNGAKRDWVQVGSPSYHFPGKSHVQYYGYPGWGDTLNTTATYNVYVFWITDLKTVRQQLSELCPPDKTNPGIIASNYAGINYNYDTYLFGPCTAAGTCDSTIPDDISKELLGGIKATKSCKNNRFNDGNYLYYDGSKTNKGNSFYDPDTPEGWAKTNCKKFWYDTGAPHMQSGCIQNLWQEAGCTTIMNDADKTLQSKYFSLNATDVRKSMKVIASATDDDNRFKCYGTDKSKWPSAAPVAPVAPVDLQSKWTKYGCTTDIKDAAKLVYDMIPAEDKRQYYATGKSQDELIKEINQAISSDSYTQQVDGYKSYMSIYNNTENDMYKAMPPDVKPTWFNLFYKSYVTPYKSILSACYNKDETKWPGYTPKWYTPVYEKK